MKISIEIKAGKDVSAGSLERFWCPRTWHMPGTDIHAALHQTEPTKGDCAPAWLACSEGNRELKHGNLHIAL